MNSRVLRLQEINLNKINYVKIKNLDSKKQIYIDYENKPLVFQCPTLLNDNLPKEIDCTYCESKTLYHITDIINHLNSF